MELASSLLATASARPTRASSAALAAAPLARTCALARQPRGLAAAFCAAAASASASTPLSAPLSASAARGSNVAAQWLRANGPWASGRAAETEAAEAGVAAARRAKKAARAGAGGGM